MTSRLEEVASGGWYQLKQLHPQNAVHDMWVAAVRDHSAPVLDGEMVKSMRDGAAPHVKVYPNKGENSIHADYNRRTNTVQNERIHLNGPDVIGAAHELGHAKINQSPFGRKVQNRAGGFSRGATNAGALTGALVGAADPDAPWWQRGLASAASSAAMSSGQLGTEGLASFHGYNMLKAHGATPDVLRAARGRLGRSWLTYLAPVVAGTASGLVTGELGSRARKWVDGKMAPPEEKTAQDAIDDALALYKVASPEGKRSVMLAAPGLLDKLRGQFQTGKPGVVGQPPPRGFLR